MQRWEGKYIGDSDQVEEELGFCYYEELLGKLRGGLESRRLESKMKSGTTVGSNVQV